MDDETIYRGFQLLNGPGDDLLQGQRVLDVTIKREEDVDGHKRFTYTIQAEQELV